MNPLVTHMVKQLAIQKTACAHPTFAEVQAYLASAFPGAERFASSFYNAMTKQHWQDRRRRTISNWRALAKRYASRAHLRSL